MSLGENLRKLRSAKHMTQKAFAKEFGVSESVISLYESNKRSPGYDLLIRFADYYGVSLDYLLDHSDFEVGKLTLGQSEAVKAGLQKATSLPELRRHLAEAILNRSLVRDDHVRKLQDFILHLND